jgi:hypothetical protein
MENVHVTQGWAKGERVEFPWIESEPGYGYFSGRVVGMEMAGPTLAVRILLDGMPVGREVIVSARSIKPAHAYSF